MRRYADEAGFEGAQFAALAVEIRGRIVAITMQ